MSTSYEYESEWWFPDSAKKPFRVLQKVSDVDTNWYTLSIRKSEIEEWVYSLPSGKWRFSTSTRHQACYDVTEEYYTWLVLRWSP